MDDTNPRPSAGVYLSLPMALGLLGLFFMPWLTLSCNPKAIPGGIDLRGAPEEAKELTRAGVLARATGWDLARGELTPDERFRELAEAQAAGANQQGPPSKLWAYGGLVLPGLLVIVAMLCAFGKITSAGAGKWMLLLGIGGVVLMCLAASVDYVDEAMDKAKDEMSANGVRSNCAAVERSMAEAAGKAKEVVQTKATPYLWACLGLYVVIAGGGLVVMGAPAPAPAPPTQSVTWQQDTAAADADMASVLPPMARDTREPGGMPNLGVDITPGQAPAPVAGDPAESG